jgi:hypothetical protein
MTGKLQQIRRSLWDFLRSRRLELQSKTLFSQTIPCHLEDNRRNFFVQIFESEAGANTPWNAVNLHKFSA